MPPRPPRCRTPFTCPFSLHPILCTPQTSYLLRLKTFSLVIRLVQLAAVIAFTLAYATSGPPVHQDLLVWPQSSTAAADGLQNITIYRWTGRKYEHPSIFQWNETVGPVPGRGMGCMVQNGYGEWIRDAERCGRGAGSWVSERVGWADSPGFDIEPGMTYVIRAERWIFIFVLTAGAVAMGHLLTVLCHALDPRAEVLFYSYAVIVDIVLATSFLLLGVFTISIQSHLAMLPSTNPPNNCNCTYGAAITDSTAAAPTYSNRLNRNQSVAFTMGWVCATLFCSSACILLLLLHELSRLPLVEPWRPELCSGLTLDGWSSLGPVHEPGSEGGDREGETEVRQVDGDAELESRGMPNVGDWEERVSVGTISTLDEAAGARFCESTPSVEGSTAVELVPLDGATGSFSRGKRTGIGEEETVS